MSRTAALAFCFAAGAAMTRPRALVLTRHDAADAVVAGTRRTIEDLPPLPPPTWVEWLLAFLAWTAPWVLIGAVAMMVRGMLR